MGSTETAKQRLIDYTTWRENVRGCTDCELHSTRTQVVVDSGTPGARVAVIGEAPGASEDQSGDVFVGPSGRLLRGLIERANILIDDVVFFNVLMCRPPNNAFPRPDVVRKCQGHTKTKLDLLQPEICIIAGRQAARWILFPEKDVLMGDVLGRKFFHPQYPFIKYLMCVYHPAYLMRQNTVTRTRMEADIVEQLQIVRNDLMLETIPVRGEPIAQYCPKKASLF